RRVAAVGVRPISGGMRRAWIPPRRPGPLPEILLAENDEVLSSWLTRLAALYRARPETLLEQLGISEVVPAVLDNGPGAAVSRGAFAARSDPAHDFHRRNAGSARFRDASFSALDLPTVRIGVHGARSCTSPPSHLVHRCRITMPALWRTAHPYSSPNQSGPAEYHRRWRALCNSCQGPRKARLSI